MKRYNVAVVGATGMVGQKMLQVLEEMKFPVDNLYPMASARSAGKTVKFDGRDYTVEELTEHSFDKPIDIALFSAGAGTSKKFAPIAAEHGVIVIDNSSCWRMDENVPLVVPEVNPEDLKDHKNIIANPNCSTIQAVAALKPIYDNYGIGRIIYSTYQAVSGSGVKGYKDLEEGSKGEDNHFYPHQIAYNCLPHIDDFLDSGYTKEEMKMVHETHKILGDYTIGISPTTVRVPVYRSHSESINLEFEGPVSVDEVRKALAAFPGVIVQDDPANMEYPMPLYTSNENEVRVGRIRPDRSVEHGLNLWVVGDQIRKGAALNALQIAEYMVAKDMF